MGGNAHARPGLSKEKHDANGPTPCWYDRLLGRPFRNVNPRLASNSKPRDISVPCCARPNLQTLIASWGQGWGAAVGRGGGMWPNGQAANLQTPGLCVQVPGCAQGLLAVLVIESSTYDRRPCGLMDKALVLGTKDCRFESCQGQFCLRRQNNRAFVWA